MSISAFVTSQVTICKIWRLSILAIYLKTYRSDLKRASFLWYSWKTPGKTGNNASKWRNMLHFCRSLSNLSLSQNQRINYMRCSTFHWTSLNHCNKRSSIAGSDSAWSHHENGGSLHMGYWQLGRVWLFGLLYLPLTKWATKEWLIPSVCVSVCVCLSPTFFQPWNDTGRWYLAIW